MTIRNLDDQPMTLLRLEAVRHCCSMEQEACDIPRRAVQVPPAGAGFADKIRQRFAGLDGNDLPIPPRQPGGWHGQVRIAEDFDAPLTEEILIEHPDPKTL